MKVAVLGEGDTCSLLLKHHGINILLDCSATPELIQSEKGPANCDQAAHLQHEEVGLGTANGCAIYLRVPDHYSCFQNQQLDAVLVTNPFALLGLPFLQHVLQQQGKQLPLHLYCTEPVYHAFQHVATELLQVQLLLQQQGCLQQRQRLPDQLQVFQQQLQLHAKQLLAQQQQQQQWHMSYAAPKTVQYCKSSGAPGRNGQHQNLLLAQHNPAAALMRPPVPPPMPPPLTPAEAAAAVAAHPPLAPQPLPIWQQGSMGSAQPAPTVPPAAVVRPPMPPPMPPPLGMAVQPGPTAVHAGAVHQATPAAAVPPLAPPPLLQQPAAAAVSSSVPPVPPPAPPALPHPAAAATGGGRTVRPPLPPPAPPPGSPTPVPAAAAAGAVRPPAPPPGSPPAAGSGTTLAASAGQTHVPAVSPAAAIQPAAEAARPVSKPGPSNSSWHTTAAPGDKLVPLFTAGQLQYVLDRLQIVRYGERVALPGCWGLTAEARPCGSSSIGAAMWVIATGSQRVTYLAPASLYPNHSAPLHTPSLKDLEALILGPGSLCPALPVLNPAEGLLRLAAAAAAHAVSAGGRVLVPVLPTGGVFQLLEHVSAALNDLVHLGTHIPLFYLSPAAPDALATANSCCEYLEAERTELVLASGQAPFGHEGLVTSGRLRLLTGVQAPAAAAAVVGNEQQKQHWSAEVSDVAAAGPCVVFVSLWSMTAGPGALLANAWCGNPHNLLLLTEQGPLTASWLQGCMQTWQQQQHWQVLYYPISSTAGAAAISPAAAAAAAAGVPHFSPAGAQPLLVGSGRVAASRTALAEGCLTARQLVGLLGLQQPAAADSRSSTVRQLLLGVRDRSLLEQAQAELRVSIDGCNVTTLVPAVAPPPDAAPGSSSSLSFQVIDLPDALLEVCLSKDFAKALLLTPLRRSSTSAADATAAAAVDDVHEPVSGQHQATAAVAVAAAKQAAAGLRQLTRDTSTGTPDEQAPMNISLGHVRGLLQYQSGVWRLEPLPGGTKPDAVAAAVDQQQQQCERLVWGSVEIGQLLGDLQAAGFEPAYVSNESTTLDDGSTVSATVIKLPTVDTKMRLSASESEIICDQWSVRQQLTTVLLKQLHCL